MIGKRSGFPAKENEKAVRRWYPGKANRHAFPFGEGQERVVSEFRLHAEDSNAGTQILRDGGAACQETSAAHADDKGVELRSIFHEFKSRSALARNDERVIEWRHQRVPWRFFEDCGCNGLGGHL